MVAAQVRFSSLVRKLPDSFSIVLADIGSAGGLHKRWASVRSHVRGVLFDPLDGERQSGRDRHFPVALARCEGRATLNVTRRVSMTSTLLPNQGLISRFWDKPQHTEIVARRDIPTESFDRIMAENRIHVDVVKIDVQGGEHDILAGARAQLTDSVFLAEIETSFLERYVGLKKFDAIIQIMNDCGFELIDVSRIKRYRYHNNFNIVNPGLGMGDRAGRLAFCDAVFLKNDEALVERIRSGGGANGPDLALKAIITLLVYGKADIAAWIFDKSGAQIAQSVREPLARFLRGLGGKHYGRKGLHRALDYLARRV